MHVFKLIATVVVLLFSTISYTAESSDIETGAFDNHCTYALSKGVYKKTDCSINAVYKGQKYCFALESSKDAFLFEQDEMIARRRNFMKINQKWPALKSTKKMR